MNHSPTLRLRESGPSIRPVEMAMDTVHGNTSCVDTSHHLLRGMGVVGPVWKAKPQSLRSRRANSAHPKGVWKLRGSCSASHARQAWLGAQVPGRGKVRAKNIPETIEKKPTRVHNARPVEQNKN